MAKFRENCKKPSFWAKFAPFWPKTAQKNFSRKIDLCHILIYITFYLHAKNQKILMTKFRENRIKPYFRAKFAPFWPKTGQKKFSQKIDPCHILILIIFDLHAKNQKILMTKFRENC